MTPVTSLAQTPAGLMAEVDKGDKRDIADARAAVETLARRAAGVMPFVESYRQTRRTTDVRSRFHAVQPLARAREAPRRKSGVLGTRVSVRVDCGGRRCT